MKALDLVEKIVRGSSAYPVLDRQVAKTAFMANLVEQLGIKLPENIFDGGFEAKFSFYSGVLVGHAKDIPERMIVAAHCAMNFPWARAIVSNALAGGPCTVTADGVPESYKSKL